MTVRAVPVCVCAAITGQFGTTRTVTLPATTTIHTGIAKLVCASAEPARASTEHTPTHTQPIPTHAEPNVGDLIKLHLDPISLSIEQSGPGVHGHYYAQARWEGGGEGLNGGCGEGCRDERRVW